MPSISGFVLSYNRQDFADSCLRSIRLVYDALQAETGLPTWALVVSEARVMPDTTTPA